jgi:hypothetical protein
MPRAFFWRKMLLLGNLLLVVMRPASARADREFGVNLFRSPSIGLEYRESFVGLHAGFYPTVVSQDRRGNNQTTWFLKLGITGYVGRFELGGDTPSAFFTSASYVRGLNHGWGHGLVADAGFRWVAWRGLNLRLGGGLLVSPGHRPRINPTPGIGWIFPLDETDSRNER